MKTFIFLLTLIFALNVNASIDYSGSKGIEERYKVQIKVLDSFIKSPSPDNAMRALFLYKNLVIELHKAKGIRDSSIIEALTALKPQIHPALEEYDEEQAAAVEVKLSEIKKRI